MNSSHKLPETETGPGLLGGNVHWFLSAAFAVWLVPGFVIAKLALAANWERFLSAYWTALGSRAICVSVLLYIVGFPLDQTLKPFWRRYCAQKPRFLLAGVLAGSMFWQFGLVMGTVIVVDGLALAELFDRAQGNWQPLRNIGRPVLAPAAYLFFGLVMMFAYNDLIASVKYLGAYDWLYLKIDSYLLPATVSQLAHGVLQKSSQWVLASTEFLYYGMFGQIGGALILISIVCGQKQGLRYVGSILTAYYLALALFYFWPSMGPFYTCADHFSIFPKSLATYEIQQSAILKAKLLMTTYKQFNHVDTDYFIAFPCMHIAQPLVVLWFLRRWKRIALCLIIYDILLVPAILLLEWHYLVDLIGGVLVAAAAIWLNLSRDHRTSEGDIEQPHAA